MESMWLSHIYSIFSECECYCLIAFRFRISSQINFWLFRNYLKFRIFLSIINFYFSISFENTTGTSPQCHKCTKSQPFKHQTTAANETIIQFQVIPCFIHTHKKHLFKFHFNRTHFFNTKHSIPYHTDTYFNTLNGGKKTIIQFHLIVFGIFFPFSFKFYFIFSVLNFCNSTKSEKSVSTNSLASPPISSFNGAGLVTQLLPLKLADKKVSF